MLRRFSIMLLTIFTSVVLSATGGTQAAALKGDSRVVGQPAPAPMHDQDKEQFRRPRTIPFPTDNAYTAVKAQLGHVLYYDTRLSGSGSLSCASCHNPGFAYGDGMAKGIGNGMRQLARRSPSIVNVAWSDSLMWDGRFASLEQQALGPITEPNEMDQPLDHLVRRLSDIADYRALFAAAFPSRAISAQTIAEAIATYERTIVSDVAPFDRWVEGDEKAISDAARRGFDLFNTKAACASCHADWHMSDGGFHDIGLPDDDVGRGKLFPGVIKMQHAFKTPSLRETARRGPYMHDGSLPTLAAVVAHYNEGGIDRPSKSELIAPLGLSPEEQADLVAFLTTLTSPVVPDFVPALPR